MGEEPSGEPPARLCLLDTQHQRGGAIHGQLLVEEVHEVCRAILSDDKDLHHLRIELEQLPAAGLRVLLRTSTGAGHASLARALPQGVTCTVHGVRTVGRDSWIFTKELEATCCDVRLSSCDPAKFKELVAAHMQQASPRQSSPGNGQRHDAAQAPSEQASARSTATEAALSSSSNPQPSAQAPQPGSHAQQQPNGDSNPAEHSADEHASTPAVLEQHAGSHQQGNSCDSIKQQRSNPEGEAACKELCQSWLDASYDMDVDDECKALVVTLAAAAAGHAEQPQGVYTLDPSAAKAYKAAAEAVLKDESMRGLTCSIRPVRVPPSHQPDAAQEQKKLPAWCKRSLDASLTQWALAQPWYLQFPASRSHEGVTGADMCLPARRAASRIRSEFPALDAYDSQSPEEQQKQGPPQQVSEQLVQLKLQQLLKRTGDCRTPTQFTERLRVCMAQLTELVNCQGLGSQSVDVCCSCGVPLSCKQLAVACTHCVDSFHLGCAGLKQPPSSPWSCPACTLAAEPHSRPLSSRPTGEVGVPYTLPVKHAVRTSRTLSLNKGTPSPSHHNNLNHTTSSSNGNGTDSSHPHPHPNAQPHHSSSGNNATNDDSGNDESSKTKAPGAPENAQPVNTPTAATQAAGTPGPAPQTSPQPELSVPQVPVSRAPTHAARGPPRVAGRGSALKGMPRNMPPLGLPPIGGSSGSQPQPQQQQQSQQQQQQQPQQQQQQSQQQPKSEAGGVGGKAPKPSLPQQETKDAAPAPKNAPTQSQGAPTQLQGAQPQSQGAQPQKPTPTPPPPGQCVGLEALAAARAQGFAARAQGFASLNAKARQPNAPPAHSAQHKPAQGSTQPHAPAHPSQQQQKGAGARKRGAAAAGLEGQQTTDNGGSSKGGGEKPAAQSSGLLTRRQQHKHARMEGTNDTAGAREREAGSGGGGPPSPAKGGTQHAQHAKQQPQQVPTRGAKKSSGASAPSSAAVMGSSLNNWGTLPEGVKPPSEGGDPRLYRTFLPGNMPQPSQEGCALCPRLARELVALKVFPGSSKWRPQALISLKLLAGAPCQYHHNINTSSTPTVLSDGLIMHDGIHCNKCRPLTSNVSEVDESENLLDSAPEPQPKAGLLAPFRPFEPCGRRFAELADYEQHLLAPGSGFAPMHVWLPRHAMYLQGVQGTRGLMELVAAEVQRSPALLSAIGAHSHDSTQQGQGTSYDSHPGPKGIPPIHAYPPTQESHSAQHQSQPSRASSLPSPHQAPQDGQKLPPQSHPHAPQARSATERQKQARLAQQERQQRVEEAAAAAAAATPAKRPRTSAGARELALLPPGELQHQRRQMRAHAMATLRMTEPAVLADMGVPHGWYSSKWGGGPSADKATPSGTFAGAGGVAGGGSASHFGGAVGGPEGSLMGGEASQEGGSEMVMETAATLLAIAGRGDPMEVDGCSSGPPHQQQHPRHPQSLVIPTREASHRSVAPAADARAGAGFSGLLPPLQHHVQQQQQQLLLLQRWQQHAGPHSHSPHAGPPNHTFGFPPTSHPHSSLSSGFHSLGHPHLPTSMHPPHPFPHSAPHSVPPGPGGLSSGFGVSGGLSLGLPTFPPIVPPVPIPGHPASAPTDPAAAAHNSSSSSNPGSAARVASLKLMRRFSALSIAARKDDVLTQAMIRTLKACRESASHISDTQLQLESMGFIFDLVNQTEEELAVLTKKRQQAAAEAQQQQQQQQQRQQQQEPQKQQSEAQQPPQETQPQIQQSGAQQPQPQQQQPQQQQQQQEQHGREPQGHKADQQPEQQQQQQGKGQEGVGQGEEDSLRASHQQQQQQEGQQPQQQQQQEVQGVVQCKAEDQAGDAEHAQPAACDGAAAAAAHGAEQAGPGAEQHTPPPSTPEQPAAPGRGDEPQAAPKVKAEVEEGAEAAHASPHPPTQAPSAPTPAHGSAQGGAASGSGNAHAAAAAGATPSVAGGAAGAAGSSGGSPPHMQAANPPTKSPQQTAHTHASATPPPCDMATALAAAAAEDSKLPQLLADAEDLQAQLREWAGLSA